MNAGKVFRRGFIFSGAAAAAASSFPSRASQLTQTSPAQPLRGTPNRAAWMQEPHYRWGVMTHYLADWQARTHKLEMNAELWNKLIDGFDSEEMARRLESVGAGHYQLSIGQNSGYYLSPNTVYDRITGIRPR